MGKKVEGAARGKDIIWNRVEIGNGHKISGIPSQ